MRNILSKWWFKILALALPATIVLGPIALVGAYAGILGIYYVLIGEGLPDETFLNNYQWWYVFRGLGGVLGLLGLWLMFIFEKRIYDNAGVLRWVVATCLCCGVIAGVLLLYDDINVWSELQRFGYIDYKDYLYAFIIFILVLIGTYYTAVCVKPNKRLQGDAAPPRA